MGNPFDSLVKGERLFEEYQPAREEISQLKRQISQLKVIIGNMNDRFDGMQRGIQDRNPLEEWQVPNDQSRILRLATVSLQDLPQFGSLCGWKFAGKDHAVTYRTCDPDTRPPDCKKCPKCHKHTSSLSDSSSGDSSSNDSWQTLGGDGLQK